MSENQIIKLSDLTTYQKQLYIDLMSDRYVYVGRKVGLTTVKKCVMRTKFLQLLNSYRFNQKVED